MLKFTCFSLYFDFKHLQSIWIGSVQRSLEHLWTLSATFRSLQKIIGNLWKWLRHFQKSWSWQDKNLMHLTPKKLAGIQSGDFNPKAPSRADIADVFVSVSIYSWFHPWSVHSGSREAAVHPLPQDTLSVTWQHEYTMNTIQICQFIIQIVSYWIHFIKLYTKSLEDLKHQSNYYCAKNDLCKMSVQSKKSERRDLKQFPSVIF